MERDSNFEMGMGVLKNSAAKLLIQLRFDNSNTPD